MSDIANSAEWDVSAHAGLAETYSTNIDLDASGNGGLITQFNPGVMAHTAGRNLSLDFDYDAGILAYHKDDSRNNVNHRLNSKATANILPELLTFSGMATVSQVAIDSEQPIWLDNLNTINRADVMTVSLGPSLHHDFGGYLITNLDYRYGAVNYRGASTISDSENVRTSFALQNGKRFNRLTGEVHYINDELMRESGVDTRRENITGSARLRLGRSFALLGRGGYVNNDLQATDPGTNGYYYSIGFAWTPSQKYTLDATKGEFYRDANLRISPNSRTVLHLGFRDTEKGEITGESWSGSLNYQHKRSTVQFSYAEELTNMQRLALVGQNVLLYFDDQGDFIVDPNTGLPVFIVANQYSLTDEEFMSKRGSIAYTLSAAKNRIGMTVSKENRQYELSGNKDKVLNVSGFWGWQVFPKTRSLLELNWQRREDLVTATTDNWRRISMELIEDIRSDLQATLGAQYTEREVTVGSGDYREYRVMVNIIKRFKVH